MSRLFKNKYDVITFGSASQDIFIFSDEFTSSQISLSLGDKVEIDKLMIHTGGGGTNAAATFASQGLRTAYCGSVGKDHAGLLVSSELKEYNISMEFLNSIDNKVTNHSVIISEQEKGRVILVYRDASNYLPKNFDLKKLKASWFYLAPLGGEYAKKTKEIIDFAHKNKIKVAFNPGKEQINLYKKSIKEILSKIDILLINDRELKLLFGNSQPKKIFKDIRSYFPGIISTGNKDKVIVSDGKYIYEGRPQKAKVADITGGGDAYGSGLVAKLIKTKDIIKAIQFASANATSGNKIWGAKSGILENGQKYHKIKIKKHEL